MNGISCGVNNEIQILKNTGCYADFTFPSLSMSNPIKVNSIYYAIDNPIKPKSYNVGINVRRSNKKRGDLMIIQGPLYPAFKKERIFGLRMEGDNINGKYTYTKMKTYYLIGRHFMISHIMIQKNGNLRWW